MSAENYVYKKEVDWSLFNYGLNIPIQHQVKFKQISRLVPVQLWAEYSHPTPSQIQADRRPVHRAR